MSDGEMDKDGFLKALLKLHRVGDWQDIDGGDMDRLYVEYGFATEETATEEDAESEFGRAWDIQEGDLIRKWTAEALRLLA